MPGIEKRGDYKPRSQREKEAYRLVVAGGGTGVVGIVTLVLAFAGITGAFLPVIFLVISAVCIWRLMRLTGQR